jgi:hypothetical protein
MMMLIVGDQCMLILRDAATVYGRMQCDFHRFGSFEQHQQEEEDEEEEEEEAKGLGSQTCACVPVMACLLCNGHNYLLNDPEALSPYPPAAASPFN